MRKLGDPNSSTVADSMHPSRNHFQRSPPTKIGVVMMAAFLQKESISVVWPASLSQCMVALKENALVLFHRNLLF